MAGKFYVTDLGNYDRLYDNFVDAETAAKHEAARGRPGVNVFQQLATVEMPIKDAITTVL